MQKIKVYKFGGGSVQDATGVRQLENIITRQEIPVVVIISAIGKTTNLMEKIVATYQAGNSTEMEMHIQQLLQNHKAIAQDLLPGNSVITAAIDMIEMSLRAQLSQNPTDNYDYDYDRIVSHGELLSTALISTYLNLKGIENEWLDARQLIQTDDSFREAHVDWKTTTPAIRNRIDAGINERKTKFFVTQGFIGGTATGETVTLGREGSDYTAAIFGFALQATEVVIWKDVPGLFNADPKIYPDAIKLDEIPYEEAIELSYYGASIIHPKTLKPLQNKQIPLLVKPFFFPEEPGSVISSSSLINPTPSLIFKKNQILISIFPKDFSFIAVQNLSEIFNILSQYRLKINLMQNSALSFSICLDNHWDRVEPALKELKVKYKVKYNDKVELATIRHYTEDSVAKIVADKEVLVEQKNRTTIQMVLKD
ncbi:aspartate kinase [Bacteroidales bacterium OttesenSCG-928-B11]|nr:aspartate kinase [Bacteroidales bacterium OttesenSCG-928-B11]MDL2325455.1 aspartate kinase [Bacteroidales bacterium OttesenSCG-928-A14]